MGDYSRIAKNTLFLYVRMLITMVVGLYTSRVLLQALGNEDYGIYNVVGGFVGMFALISGALTGAISRFLTFELGRNNIEVLKNVFSTSLIVLLSIGIIVVIFGETVGIWFLHNKLVIPSPRMYAASWVFQLCLLSFIINLIVIPYNACIISHEKMDAFAYISFIDVACKLIICFCILHSPIDRLIFYAILLFIVSSGISLIYIYYCKHNFEECHFKFYFHSDLLKKIFRFAGWSFIGSSGWILKNQGGSILLNLFGGPIVNTANAVAYALSSAATNFANCFTTSFNPQITKQYAKEEYLELQKLIIHSAKFSYYMLYVIALPIILNAYIVSYLWLGDVPMHTVNFVRLILIISLIDIISVPLVTLKNATGEIKNYQIIVGGIQLLSIPIGYIFLKFGAPVESLYIAYILVSLGCLIARMIVLKGDIPYWSSSIFIRKVCYRIIIVSIVSAIVPIIIYNSICPGWGNLIITSICSVLSCGLFIYTIGIDNAEREFIKEKIINKIKSKVSIYSK